MSIKKLKQLGEDFEFYPTPERMIKVVSDDMKSSYHNFVTLIDVGGGDGRVLDFISKNHNVKTFIIEKSDCLINKCKPDHIVVGVDFYNTNFMDKNYTYLFCNPPYSEYDKWMYKILSETNINTLYFIVPSRWNKNGLVNNVIKDRRLKYKILSSDTFSYGVDRLARANVDIIKFTSYFDKDSSFKSWFSDNFEIKDNDDSVLNIENEVKKELVAGRNIIDVLVSLYDAESEKIINDYQTITNLDKSLLSELRIDNDKLFSLFKERVKSLKNKYWSDLFDRYEPLNRYLTSETLKSIKKTLFTTVDNEGLSSTLDFNSENAYAVTGWAIKNTNKYIEKQVIEFFEELASSENCVRFKSNEKVFTFNYYRYNDDKNHIGKISLKQEYRIITTVGGLHTGESYLYRNKNGIKEGLHIFLKDSIAIARSFGFSDIDRIEDLEYWETSKQKVITALLGCNRVDFLRVRAYKKGTAHLLFHQHFVKSLNVVHGKYRGWLKDKSDFRDMGMKESDIEKYINVGSFRLGGNAVKLLSN